MTSSVGKWKSVPAAVCVLLSLLVCVYAFLIQLGRWQLDEYAEFFHMRTEPHFLLRRFIWSPRVFSEALYIAYGWTVNHFHRQFTAQFLCLLWIVLLVFALYTPIQKFRERCSSALSILLISLGLLALILSSGYITEVFYWPAGAVAYIPTLGASLLLFLQSVDGRLQSAKGRIVASVCLLIAAGSSETGATLAICYAVVQIVSWARERFAHRSTTEPRPLLWSITPLLVALPVMGIVAWNRFRLGAVVTNPTVGHKSFAHLVLRGAAQIVVELVGHDLVLDIAHHRTGPKLLLAAKLIVNTHLWAYLLLFAGVALLWSQFQPLSRSSRKSLVHTLFTFALSCIAILAASLLQFGTPCCERHELMRYAWIDMIVAGCGVLCAPAVASFFRGGVVWLQSASALLLLLSVLSLHPISPLLQIVRSLPRLHAAEQQNEASGFTPNAKRMDFIVLPNNEVIREEVVRTGTFTRPKTITGFSGDVYPDYLLGFYNKDVVTISPLGKNEPSK